MNAFLNKLNEKAHSLRWTEHAEVIFTDNIYTIVHQYGRSYLFLYDCIIADKMSKVEAIDAYKWIEAMRKRDLKTIESYEKQIADLQEEINMRKVRWNID